MGKTSIICVIIVFALLLEDSSSVRKKTEDERKEDEEIAEKVNATLAKEEAERKKEEDERKKRLDLEKKKNETQKKDEIKKKKIKEESSEGSGGFEGRDEALPSSNSTCPVCPEVQDCPVANCSGQCKACPKCKDPEECPPVLQCPGVNRTSSAVPDDCPESSSQPMSIPVAMAVGATASLLVTGVAAAIGLLLRYASPIVSGFVFLASLILMWYLSSHHPETARELGGRAVTVLREAVMALSHRVVEAIRSHNEQVSFPA
jgi:hypothetical protein